MTAQLPRRVFELVEGMKLSTSTEAQAFLDGGIAMCDREVTDTPDHNCDDHATMVIEFGQPDARRREARCELHGYWALVKDDVERVERPLS